MRWQTTTALAVVLLLVGGFYYVYEVRWAPDRERAETRKGRVFAAEAADVTAVELKRRDDTLRLALGSKTPTGVWVYARETGKPAVVVLSDGMLREATKPATEFRDRTILTLDRNAVSGFDIAADGGSLAVAHVGDAWRITRPAALSADTEAVGNMFEKLTAAKVKEFVAETPRSLATYGLDTPLRLTIHTGKDKERASRTLLVGRNDQAKKGVYAMREGESSVLLLPEDVATAIPRTVGALRDKHVVALDRDRVMRVDLESPKGAVTLAREKDRWTITAPQALPADQVEAGALLTRLRELRAQGFLSDDASAIPRVLAKPTVKLTITEQGKPPTTVLLGPSGERRGGALSAYAAVAGRARAPRRPRLEARGADQGRREGRARRRHHLRGAGAALDADRRPQGGGRREVRARRADAGGRPAQGRRRRAGAADRGP